MKNSSLMYALSALCAFLAFIGFFIMMLAVGTDEVVAMNGAYLFIVFAILFVPCVYFGSKYEEQEQRM